MKKSHNYYNYCVCFIDLLGQRQALSQYTLLPNDEKELQKFKDDLPNSIGAIIDLQNKGELLVKSLSERSKDSLIHLLPEEQKKVAHDIESVRIRSQRWSDGIMYFSSLGDKAMMCPINAIYHMISFAGILCFCSLADRAPIRGAIDIGWGVELWENELYGASVANAYILESERAIYPRVVVGKSTYEYIVHVLSQPITDIASEYSVSLAQLMH